MHDLQFGNAISTFSSSQYLRGPLVYLIRSLQSGASTMWRNGSDGGFVGASASLSSYMDTSCRHGMTGLPASFQTLHFPLTVKPRSLGPWTMAKP